jgi:DNA-binding NarL/FixJ family response regulator
MQVLERVANGESNKEIAKALKRAEVTIERHLTRLFRASGSRCRTELITKLFSLAP